MRFDQDLADKTYNAELKKIDAGYKAEMKNLETSLKAEKSRANDLKFDAPR